MTISSLKSTWRTLKVGLWATAMAALLAACGGGGGSSTSTTTPVSSATTTTAGTVNGFASVIVDGKEIEDATATTRVENADGSYTPVALKLGQRVEVTQSVHSSTASSSTSTSTTTASTSILVQAAVMGSVSSINTSAGEFKAAGQWVKVNTDATAGPVTVYGGGYTAITSLAANDLVEVHGSAAYSTAKAAYVIQASRIDKQNSISAVRISGKVASLDTTAKTFALNGVTVKYSAATVVPTGTTLANDQTVFVWGPSGSLTGGSAPVLTATRLRINTGTATTATVSGTGQIGGLVNGYNASTKTFDIDGVSVNASAAVVTPTGASLASGAYVDVNGSFGSSGVLTATSIRVRQQDTTAALATIRLNGAISSYVSNTSFVVRGLPVDASAISLATACPGVTLANGVVVDINASQQTGTDVLKATSMRCKSSTAGYTMRSIQGTAGTVDTTAKTFVLTQTSGTQKAQWTDQTAWGTGVTASTLSTVTNTVVVEGYLDSTSVLVARSIRMLGTADVDRYSPDTGPIYCANTTTTGSTNTVSVTASTSASTSTTATTSVREPCGRANEGWDSYDATHRPGKK